MAKLSAQFSAVVLVLLLALPVDNLFASGQSDGFVVGPDGVRRCRSGLTACPTSKGQACTNIKTDRNNCGKCGAKCSAGSSCCSGVCTITNNSTLHCGKCGNKCPTGQPCCGGSCINLMTDPLNCKTCGTSCVDLSTGDYRSCCSGACVNTGGNDTTYCGGCPYLVKGKMVNPFACKKTEQCCYGKCQLATETCVTPGRR
eukprot:TRINITY_DN7769_c0_g1_i2.p1 TRINITY_DN7769_c0_g1~~TRINITY_DN7769_c0_g1_i2.p1  ORF type:complete len:229 (-),score=15.66 TRINITY_DN7769_c0_g1_i2:199-798(-)